MSALQINTGASPATLSPPTHRRHCMRAAAASGLQPAGTIAKVNASLAGDHTTRRATVTARSSCPPASPTLAGVAVLALVAIAWPRHPARARSRSWMSTRRRGPSSAFGALLPAVALRARGSRSSALVGTLAGLALARPRQPARDRARLKCGQVQRHTAWATRAVLLPRRGRGARVRRGQELARGAGAVRRSERVRSRANLTRLVRIY